MQKKISARSRMRQLPSADRSYALPCAVGRRGSHGSELYQAARIGGCFIAFVFYFFTSPPESDEKIFFAVTIAFWAFFFFRMTKVFYWRRAGRELLRIREDNLTIKNAFGNYGKARLFQIENIQKFGTIPYDFKKYGQFLDRSFWEMGGETIGFEHFGKAIRFGKQLSDQESKQLAKILQKAFKDIPADFNRKISDALAKDQD